MSMQNSKKNKEEIEEILILLWKDTLNKNDISLKDNFFAIGGDSYLLVLIQNKLSTDWNIQVPFSVLYQKPTLIELREYILNSAANGQIISDSQRRAHQQKNARNRQKKREKQV